MFKKLKCRSSRLLQHDTRRRQRNGHKRLGIESLEDRRLLAKTVGVLVNEPEAYEGYTLFAPSASGTTYLVDMEGSLVNSWQSQYPPMSAYLQENGDLLRVARLPNTGQTINAPGASGRVELFNWEGDLRWSFELNETDRLADGIPDRRLHHDIELMPNGNILMIAWERLTPQQARDLGRRDSLPTDNNGELWPDIVVEVKPNSPDPDGPATSGGEIVWSWHLKDHVTTNPAAHPDRVDINFVPSGEGAGGVLADWTHFNGIDYNPQLDQIIVSSREFGEFWIIDHSTTTAQAASHRGGDSGKGGDLLYRWGNPQTYGQGTAADQQLFYQHDAQWIEPGLEGAGNILVFNNGWDRQGGASYSSVEELVAPVSHQWYFNNATDGSPADLRFDTQSGVPQSWIPITGDWDGSGTDTGGFYNPQSQQWHLNNATDGSAVETVFNTSWAGVDASWIPLTGDWNNDGFDTVGLYDPSTNDWVFSNAIGSWGDVQDLPAPADVPNEWLPIAGDWNGDGFDTVGLHDPSRNWWVLNNRIDGSTNDLIVFQAPGAFPSWKPIAGDWNNNGKDTVGLYNPSKHRWYLNNKTNGSINDLIVINGGDAPASGVPLTGDWDGDGRDTIGFYDTAYAPGNYSRSAGSAYGPSQPLWEYNSSPRSEFFATIISGAQRLPNGNTLINEGTEGRFFEVNRQSEIVWEYVSPVLGTGIQPQGEPLPVANIGIPGVKANLVFRAYRYGIDYLDASLDVTPGDTIESGQTFYDTIGLYDPSTNDWFLNNSLDGTLTDVIEFNTGQSDPVSWIPIVGDWDNDGTDSVGLYDPAGAFYLNNATDGSIGDLYTVTVQVAGARASWLPISGDWDNDGFDTVGLYNPATNNWYLDNEPLSHVWDDPFVIKAPVRVPSSWIPVTGDWNGNGFDTVGLYDPAANDWYLNNKIDGSITDLITLPAPVDVPASWIPVTGDWNGNGKDSVGLFVPSSNTWYLNNQTDGSLADLITVEGPAVPSSRVPITGDWNGSKTQRLSAAVVAAASTAPSVEPERLTERQLQPIVSEAVTRIKQSGEQNVATLDAVTFEIVDLPGAQLARAEAGLRVLIDRDAAGFCWYIDPSPGDDHEFALSVGGSDLLAPPSTAALPRMDLLTTVMHELGHVLGYQHASTGLMRETLASGTRDLWQTIGNEPDVFAEDLAGGSTMADDDTADAVFADLAKHGPIKNLSRSSAAGR